jgi:ComF family protein
VAEPPAYDRARSVLAYDEHSRGLVLGFKHGDRLEGAAAFAAWMARAGAELLTEVDLIAPVPLHRRRLFHRRYNQSAILALAIGRYTGRPVAVDLLRRIRPTPSQGGLSPAGRARNVRGAFAVNQRALAKLGNGALAGRRVLLVDDVLTTGATVSTCTRVLRRAGAGGVDVLTLSRVVRPLPISI